MSDFENYEDVRHAVRNGLADVVYQRTSPPSAGVPMLRPGRVKAGRPGPVRAVVGAALLVVLVLAVPLALRVSGGDAVQVGSGEEEGWLVNAHISRLATPEDIDHLVGLVRDAEPSAAVMFYSTAEVWEEARHLMRHDRSVLEVLESDPDILPPSLRIVTDSRTVADRLVGMLRGYWRVEEIELHRPSRYQLVPAADAGD